jgi:hypothetical protein
MIRLRRHRLRTATIPAATDCLAGGSGTKQAGLDQMALRTFPTPGGTTRPGRPRRLQLKTPVGVAWSHEEGCWQINSTVCGETAPHFEKMAAFVEAGVVFWEVFFWSPRARGSVPQA